LQKGQEFGSGQGSARSILVAERICLNQMMFFDKPVALLCRAVLCCAVLTPDGDRIQKGQEFGSIQGSARSILVAERICLNFMQRMSGIATATAAMVTAAAGHKAT
jgi:nicotinate-nucleotide pyrophosphorylase